MLRLHIRYTGRVQGVGFRMTAQAVAESLNLTGWVRNEPDGSVTLEIQGPDPLVRDALDGIPRVTRGRVERVDESPRQVDPSERGFEIRR